MKAASVLSLLIAICTLGASPLAAQSVEGKLLDYETGQPISGAIVALLDHDGEAVRNTLTAPGGSFIIEAPSTGQYRLRAERIGYQTTTTPPIDILSEEPLQVEMRMSTEAILLAPLTVTSERMPIVLNRRLARWGYYERKGTVRG